MFKYPTIITDNSFQTVIDGRVYSVDRSHPNFREVIDAVKEGRWEDVPSLTSIATTVMKYVDGKIEVDADAGVVKYQGEQVSGTIVDRIMDFMAQELPVEPLCRFIDNVNQNPSKRAVDELFGFIEYGKMPLTEDGCFLAYKRVNDDYTSVHDGKTDNSIGRIVEMPRNKVNDNKDETCSHGLHFCSHEYLKSFHGKRVVILKINPRDVVSIPTDYNNTKGRACRYEVVGELTPDEVQRALAESVWTSALVDYEDRDTWEGDEDYDPFNDSYNEEDDESFREGYDRGYRNAFADVSDGAEYNPYEYEWFNKNNQTDVGYKAGYQDGWNKASNMISPED